MIKTPKAVTINPGHEKTTVNSPTNKPTDLDSQIREVASHKESVSAKMDSLDRKHPERKKLFDDWHALNDKHDQLINSKHVSNMDQNALKGIKDTHDTENVMFHGSLNNRLSGFKSHDQNPKSSNYGQRKGVGVSFSPNASYSEKYTTKNGLGEGKKGQVYKVVPTRGSILDVHKNPNAIKEAAERLGVSEHISYHYNSQPNIQLEFAIGKKYPELDEKGIYNFMSQNGIKGFSVGGDYGKEYLVHDPSDFAVFSEDGKLVSKHSKMSKSDKIPGGLAEGKKPSDFPKLKIREGVKVEMEHTSDPKIAEEISMDHLAEDPDYYEKLKTIEKKPLDKSQSPSFSYTHTHDPNIDQHRIVAHDNTGKPVGGFIFEKTPNGYSATSSQVLNTHRRMGVASGAYKHFEDKTGNKLVPHVGRGGEDKRSDDAKALWSSPKRSFGKAEMEKALSPEEITSQGYRFKILNPTKAGRGFAVRAYQGKKAVGHLVFSDRADNPVAAQEHQKGFHSVTNGNIEEEHRGKGLYQHMIKLAGAHAKSLGSKGVYTSGSQRSKASTRAWDKVATFASRNPYTHETRPTTAENSDYYLATSEMKKGARGDWKKEGYKLSFSTDKHGIHYVNAHDNKGNHVGEYQFVDDHPNDEGGLYVNLAETHPDHQRKGLASSAYDLAQKMTGLPVNPSLSQSPDAKRFWLNRLSASELDKSQDLSKMSRPRITFPNFPKVNTRPDQGVQIVDTNRQKDLWARKVANASVKTTSSSPSAKMMAQHIRDKESKRVRPKFNENLGMNANTPLGPAPVAQSGQARSKFENFDESHPQRLKEHKEAKAKAITEWNEKARAWKQRALEIYNDKSLDSPTRQAMLLEHNANIPQKIKLPRAPAKKKISDKNLTTEQKTLRGKKTDLIIEHEGFHSTIDRIANHYGEKNAKNALSRLAAEHDPETLEAVKGFISTYKSYDVKSPSFLEEALAHTRDILVDPTERGRFKQFVGTDNFDRHIKNLKIGHQKAYRAAQAMAPEQEEVAAPSTGKLAASEEMKKAPFEYFGGTGSAYDNALAPSKKHELVHTDSLPGGLIHEVHAYKLRPNVTRYHHGIVHPEHGLVSSMQVTHDENDTSPAVTDSSTSKEHRGNGYGHALYGAALHFHGKLKSDNIVSRAAHKVHVGLGSMPGVLSDVDDVTFTSLEGKTLHGPEPKYGDKDKSITHYVTDKKSLGRHLGIKPHKTKLAASEEMKKAPFVDDHNVQAANNLGPYVQGGSKAKVVNKFKVGEHTVHHWQSEDGDSFVVHRDYNPKLNPIASVNVGIQVPYPEMDEKYHDNYYVEHSAVHPDHSGKGLGRAAYKAAIKHFGTLQSSTAMSPKSNEAWNKLSSHPQIKVKFGKDDDTPHIARYVKNPKKMAASELHKNEAADKETEKIKENKKSPEAQKPHKFSPAKWTHPNGHPRCSICGDEERTGGMCEGQKIEKGAIRRIYGKFDPRKELGERDAKNMANWIGGNSEANSREKIPSLSVGGKLRATNKLVSRTQSRKNPSSGEREFLLHRQMSEKELSSSIKNGKMNYSSKTSWTPSKEKLMQTAGGIYGEPHADYNHLVSAWVPESAISTYIPQLGRHASADLGSNKEQRLGPSQYMDEQEVILHPHSSEIHEIHRGDIHKPAPKPGVGYMPKKFVWSKIK